MLKQEILWCSNHDCLRIARNGHGKIPPKFHKILTAILSLRSELFATSIFGRKTKIAVWLLRSLFSGGYLKKDFYLKMSEALLLFL